MVMDIRLNAIKDSQGKISFSDTSSLTAVDYATGHSDLENEKSNTEIDDDDTKRQDDRVELLGDDTMEQSRSLHQLPQHERRRRWWHNITTAQDTTNTNKAYSWKTQLYQQLRRFLRYVRQLDRRQIMECVVRWRWVLMFFGSSLIMGILMWIWRKDLLRTLEGLSIAVRDMGASGQVLIFFLIFASAFPPMIGYGTFQSLSGFTFGFNLGFPISYFSALFGAIACFVISRRWLKVQVQNIMAKYPNLEAVVKAVDKKGFKLFVLIRLSPYPFNLLNVLFASTDIPLSYFALGTAISLIKIGLHVYIGAHLTSFAKHVLGDGSDLTESERKADTIREIAVVIGSILAIGVMIYVYFVAKRAVEEVKKENEEARAFLESDCNIAASNQGPVADENRIAMEQVGVADNWIEWNQSDEEKTIGDHGPSGDLAYTV